MNSDELPLNYKRQEAALRSPDQVYYDKHHERYHEAQNSRQETAAKILARATGIKSVRCTCGQEFPSAVSG